MPIETRPDNVLQREPFVMTGSSIPARFLMAWIAWLTPRPTDPPPYLRSFINLMGGVEDILDRLEDRYSPDRELLTEDDHPVYVLIEQLREGITRETHGFDAINWDMFVGTLIELLDENTPLNPDRQYDYDLPADQNPD